MAYCRMLALALATCGALAVVLAYCRMRANASPLRHPLEPPANVSESAEGLDVARIAETAERENMSVEEFMSSPGVVGAAESWNMSVSAYLESCESGCCGKTCGACMQESSSCRWCTKTQNCHKFGSLVDKCVAPINSYGQCQSATCPYVLGDFVSDRPDTTAIWAEKNTAAAFLPLQPYAVYDYSKGETGIFDLATGKALSNASEGGKAEKVRVVLLSDWGSGTCESKTLAALVAKALPHMTIHLADVYYVGTEDEFKTNMLGGPHYKGQEGVAFPKGQHSTFLMCGNHEIIAGNTGLVLQGYKYSGQKASYAAWQSDHWRIVALDTGYESYKRFINGTRDVLAETDAPNPKEVVDWLTQTLKLDDAGDKRGIVVLSHHQPYSDFESSYLGAAKQLQKILPEGRTVLWFFGHEHRLALYDKLQLEGTGFYVLPRMVGNGGFPNVPVGPKRKDLLFAYDKRTYQTWPNDLGANSSTGFLGYFTMEVTGDTIEVSYATGKCKGGDCNEGYDENEGTVVATETVKVDLGSGEVTQKWTHVGPELTTLTDNQARLGNLRSGRSRVPVVQSLPPTGGGGVFCNLEQTSMD